MSSVSRIGELFARKQSRILNIYVTAGFPTLNSTIPVMLALQESGVDIIELGIPYSDPIADGPVIQRSNSIALSNGMSIETLFEQLKEFRSSISIPVILMGYLNPVLQYGFERFCNDAAKAGVDGLILPELPPESFEQYRPVLKKNNLDLIFLVTPETSLERIKWIDSLSRGFLYAVASSTTTGSVQGKTPDRSYVERLADARLNNPVLVGFGISDNKGFEEVAGNAAGAIIGSAYIKVLEDSGDVNSATKSFVSGILGVS